MAETKDPETKAPAQADTATKPVEAPADTKAPIAEAVAEAVAEKPVETKAAPKQVAAKAKPAAKPRKTRKTRAKKAPVPKVAKKKTPAKAAAAAKKAVRKPVAAKKTVKTKDTKTMTKKTKDPINMTTEGFQAAMADVTERTKAAYEKGNEMFAEAGTFAKGNVEAAVEASKIFAAGVQDMSRDAIAEGRDEFEKFTAEVKDLAAVKSPTDFFQLQSAMMRRYFDKAVANSAKNTEAMIKLANDAAQPIQNRISIAVDKVRAA